MGISPRGIGRSLELTLKESALVDAALDLSEAGLDSVLESGVLRDLPVFSTLYGSADAARRLAEHLFEKKLLKFLQAPGEVPIEKRRKMISKLENEPGFEQRVGERVIALLTRLDDTEKASLMGRAFAAYCNGSFDSQMLARLWQVIDRIEIADLAKLMDYRQSEVTDQLTLQAFAYAGLAFIPHGMGTAYYVPNAPLCDAMLRFVLVRHHDTRDDAKKR